MWEGIFCQSLCTCLVKKSNFELLLWFSSPTTFEQVEVPRSYFGTGSVYLTGTLPIMMTSNSLSFMSEETAQECWLILLDGSFTTLLNLCNWFIRIGSRMQLMSTSKYDANRWHGCDVTILWWKAPLSISTASRLVHCGWGRTLL